MPTYDYECAGCGHCFELRRGFDSPSEEECPLCHAVARRKIHSVGVIFKGSGWYVTDYGRPGSTATPPSSNGTSQSKPETKTESKAEAKPAAKPEAKATAATTEKKD